MKEGFDLSDSYIKESLPYSCVGSDLIYFLVGKSSGAPEFLLLLFTAGFVLT